MRWIAAPSTRVRTAGRPIATADNGSAPAPGSTVLEKRTLLARVPPPGSNGTHPPAAGRLVGVAAERPRSRSVLVVVAHPDDETLAMGGTLAWLAHRGQRVTIVCATRGELGWIADPLLATRASLGAVREQELRRAAQVLGVHDVCLLDYRDGTLPSIDPAELRDAFAAAMRRSRAEVVFSWGPDGGYGHPDHSAVHRAVTAAFFATATQPNDPRALYYFSVHQPALISGLRWLSQHIRRGRGGRVGGRGARSPLRPPRISTKVDVSAFRKIRLEALSQYRTQIPADVWQRGMASLLAPRNNFAYSRVECFHRAYPPSCPDEPIESAFGRPLWKLPAATR